MKNKNVIYTVVIGGYDELREPRIITPGWDYICFSDSDIKSDIWEIRKIKLDPNLSNRKNARKIKTLYHNYVGEYDTTVYVPGFSVIKIDLDTVAKLLEPSYDMVTLLHPYRSCLFDEAEYMIKHTGDPGDRIRKQSDYYKEQGMPTKFSLSACGLLVRRTRDKNVIKHCKFWWEEILKYSPRDQISFMYVYWKYNLISLKRWNFNNFKKYLWEGNLHVGDKNYLRKHAAD